MSDPLRLVQVGAGLMGQWWLRTLVAHSDVQLVGLVDLDPDQARRALAAVGRPEVPVARTVGELGDRGAAALLDAVVPAAHHRVNTEALLSGLDVLTEKPLAESVAESLSMAAAAEVSGRLLMVSQSRRYFRAVGALRRQLAALGPLQALGCHFAREVHLEGFRELMAEPLLVDMAIHQMDLARLLTRSEPVSVYAESHNPPWSWFSGGATAHLVAEFADGARFVYSGTFVGPGRQTSWNGEWQLAAEHGSVSWDGDAAPVATRGDGTRLPAEMGQEPEQIEGSLGEFVHAVRTGQPPQSEVHDNVMSVAMVETAVRSATEHRRVTVAEVLDDGYARALAAETRPEVRDALAAWPSVHEVVGRPRSPSASTTRRP